MGHAGLTVHQAGHLPRLLTLCLANGIRKLFKAVVTAVENFQVRHCSQGCGQVLQMIVLYIQLFKTLKNMRVHHDDLYTDERMKITTITGEFPYSFNGGYYALGSREKHIYLKNHHLNKKLFLSKTVRHGSQFCRDKSLFRTNFMER